MPRWKAPPEDRNDALFAFVHVMMGIGWLFLTVAGDKWIHLVMAMAWLALALVYVVRLLRRRKRRLRLAGEHAATRSA